MTRDQTLIGIHHEGRVVAGRIEAVVSTPQDGQLRIELKGIGPRWWLPNKRFNELRGLATNMLSSFGGQLPDVRRKPSAAVR